MDLFEVIGDLAGLNLGDAAQAEEAKTLADRAVDGLALAGSDEVTAADRESDPESEHY
ncbi:MAG: hypothetical protein M3Y17_13975 [Actinomycetota bacterium]|nr:hypothetical protein [Actinomycetota bacterium]